MLFAGQNHFFQHCNKFSSLYFPQELTSVWVLTSICLRDPLFICIYFSPNLSDSIKLPENKISITKYNEGTNSEQLVKIENTQHTK